jgi:hypothetical protein
MAFSKSKLKSNGDRASPCFKPFLIRNVSDKFLPARSLLFVAVRHIFISLTSSMGIPDSTRILYKTSVLTESIISFLEVYRELINCFVVFPRAVLPGENVQDLFIAELLSSVSYFKFTNAPR